MNDSILTVDGMATQLHAFELLDTIQSHGCLLCLDEPDLTILQVSANSLQYLGLTPKQLLGQCLDSLWEIAPLRQALASLDPDQNHVVPLLLPLQTPKGLCWFDGFLHRAGAVVVLELEPTAAEPQMSLLSFHGLVRETMAQIQRTISITELFTVLVQKIRALTGFDRVLVCQFDHQGAGEVIAEAKQDQLSAYRGLHFPAYDIPEQIRESYRQGTFRAMPNLHGERISLVPPMNPQTEKPLDLNLAILRSVHPCAIEYYHNMGVSAALVFSLTHDQQLWGVLSCHHSAEKHVPYEVRAICELLTQMTALEMANKVRQDNFDQQAKIHGLQSQLIAAITQADNFIDALIYPQEQLLGLVNASGVAICLGDQLTLLGDTPTTEQIRWLMNWADREISDNLFHTNCLSTVCPGSAAFKQTASGLLLLQISRVQHYLIFWFRPEVLQSIDWAGNPEAVIAVDQQNHQRLCPRASFERWRELVHGSSLPWQPHEIRGVQKLRNAIVGILLKKAEELAQLNRELEHSNQELASFAYAAAHDLKEPLRGIYNYSEILIEDYLSALDEEGQQYLTEIQAFAQRMETLINALLRIAQLRQATLQYQLTDLNGLLQDTMTVVRANWPDAQVHIHLPQPLPQLQCDPVLMNEVFRNLISNAIKYNDQSQKRIEVGYQEEISATEHPVVVFYIQDNGIGIREDHFNKIFLLFRRLHPQERYGGGAGIGLAVVNQIIDRHGGQLWVESTPGEGSRFFFSLPVQEPH
jgi:chemotaxis family two-component system sensor kinase Cph1